MMDEIRVLIALSLRSLVSHKIKSAIVGLIMLSGTFLLVLGTAILDSIEHSMARSIVSSLVGHLQVYDAEAEDELALFGGFGFGSEDLGEIEDFGRVKGALMAVDNVEAVVPMGISATTTSAIGELEQALEALRLAIDRGDEAKTAEATAEVRALLDLMHGERTRRGEIEVLDEGDRQEAAIVEEARSERFWADFERDPAAGLERLDTRVAPLSAEGQLLYLRFLGTDLQLFSQSFDRFRIVDGEMVPPGKKGFLISKRIHERQIKHKVARELDEIHSAVVDKGQRIDEDTRLQDRIRRNARQHRLIVVQLSPDDALAVEEKLRGLLPKEQGDLSALIQAFLTVDDDNLEARHAFFYAEIAPRIRLYTVNVGDVITLRSFSRTGYIKAVNVKVYGTFTFEGLERSDLAGATSLTDMITFRELFGQFTAEQAAEMSEMKREVGVKEIDRESAEAALFGGGGALEVEGKGGAGGFDEFEGVDLKRQAQEAGGTYTQEDLDEGMALSAAILLKDPDRMSETMARIEEVSAEAGLGLQVVDWQSASGMVGQFIAVIRGVLYVAIFIIFLVALVIMNNSMIMATMERVGEIGTMRAIGAQRGFIMAMFLVETVVLGLLSGGLGALLGAGFITWLGSVGIPATADVLVLLFAGPRLHPFVGVSHMLLALGVILVVSLGSTLYPAWVATRIQPVEAMRRKDQGG